MERGTGGRSAAALLMTAAPPPSSSSRWRRGLERVPPVLILLVALWLGWVAAGRWAAPPGWQRLAIVASSLCVLLALMPIVRALREFRRWRTTVRPHGRPTQLVDSGPFRFSRNPIYRGLLVLALLPFTWTGEPAALLAPVLVFAYLNGITIPAEEARLAALFPESFSAYCRRVRRW